MYDSKEYLKERNKDGRLEIVKDTITRSLTGIGSLKIILTERQIEILRMIVLEAKLNRTIAKDLGLVERTVEEHRRKIMHKLKASNSVELTKLVFAMGLDRELFR